MPDRIVNKIVFSANGEDGNVRGATLTIDNFDLVPASGGFWRGGARGAQLKWSAAKTPAGISGYSFAIDQDATTIPPERANNTTGFVELRTRSGTWYGHVRACDQAGNWGTDKTVRLEFGKTTKRQNTRIFDDDN